MKRLLLSALALAALSINGFSQARYGNVDVAFNNDNTKMDGVKIEFYDAIDTAVGYQKLDFLTDPIVNDTDEYLEITTNTHTDTSATDWWTWGSLQYFHFKDDGSGDYDIFDVKNFPYASFTVNTPVKLGFNFKIDQTTWAADFKTLEFKDTIETLNQDVTIYIDWTTAQNMNGADINLDVFTTHYLYLYTLAENGDTEYVVKLKNAKLGSKADKPTPPIAIEAPIAKDGDFGAILNSDKVVKVEVINALGQVTQEASSVKALNLNGTVSIIKATLKDGSVKVGKIAK